jgi:site-specific recombinase XerD
MGRETYKKIITSPELIKQINPENKKLVARFLKEKNTRTSDLTIINYESDLNIFMVWNLLNNDNKLFTDMRKLEFADFFSFTIEEMKWGSARFSRVKSALSSFSNFIEKFYDDIYPTYRNIVLKAVESMPKNPAREKTVLSETQVDELLSFLKTNSRKQESCFLALGLATGARISELLKFTIDIIDENNLVFNDVFIETTKEIKTKGRGKAGKLLKKYIIKDLFLPYYKEWLIERDLIMSKNNQEHKYVFIKNDGTPAGEDFVRRWIPEWEEVIKVPFYFHALRHYFVTHLTRIGLNQDFITEIVGWQSVEMFKLYNDLTVKDRDWKELDKLQNYLDNK